MIVVDINNVNISYETQIIDETHLKMKILGTNSWGTPLHIEQVNSNVILQLHCQGYVNDEKNYFY